MTYACKSLVYIGFKILPWLGWKIICIIEHYVTFNSIKSVKQRITCGAPQGSILGPLLFLLYVNDLATVSNAFWSVLFTDDTSLFISGKDPEAMCDTINNDLAKNQQWLYCNKLPLNVVKTHYMIFTARNKTATDLDVKTNEVRIERVYETKFLGVLVDSQLTWKQHTEYTCKNFLNVLEYYQRLGKSFANPLYWPCIIHLLTHT